MERPVKVQSRGESCAHPQGVSGFDKHATGTYVAGAATQDRRAPLDFEIGAERKARSPSAFSAPGGRIASSHETGETSCQRFRAAAPGRNRRMDATSIRLVSLQTYDAE